MSTPEPGLHHRTDTFVLGLAVRSLDCHPEPLGGRRKGVSKLGEVPVPWESIDTVV